MSRLRIRCHVHCYVQCAWISLQYSMVCRSDVRSLAREKMFKKKTQPYGTFVGYRWRERISFGCTHLCVVYRTQMGCISEATNTPNQEIARPSFACGLPFPRYTLDLVPTSNNKPVFGIRLIMFEPYKLFDPL